MIDIHSHVLPGVDDGARTIEESLEMLRLAAASGTTEIVATPHANAQFTFEQEKVEELFRELSERCSEPIQLYLGCDFHLDYDNVCAAVDNPEKYTINHGRYLMAEPPDYCSALIMRQALKALVGARITPIITHPERNLSLQTKVQELEQLIDDGCMVQVTGHSLLGYFGSQAKRAADALLDQGLVHFVASDAHDCVNRSPDLSLAYKYVVGRLGVERADELFVHNPAAAVRDEYIAPAEKKRPEASRRFAFWK